MTRYEELTQQLNMLDNKLNKIKGSTDVLKQQYQDALTTLKNEHNIDPDNLEGELQRVEGEMQNLDNQITKELAEYEAILNGGTQNVQS